ncbi:MAG TPA: CDP-alcohol phosphatidyltransferase family protein [Lacibacter sp.]|nr:CDP-alcohol phosphatidyltransferase family protein [Lacibacter sp.]HMO87714.1 CDP-alcohol phosphatidyltransferase family protein [Lacibacter sp.]HMP86242.1 CDP-alcohol phosphatidyltransferase family protein [Lacibacter sp.]
MKQIPNIFTLFNLVFGCIAILLILDSSTAIVTLQQGDLLFRLPERMVHASFFIFAAGLVDFLDGFLARAFKATSDMGKQLDSLSDVVTFGVAPSLLLYQLLRMSFLRDTGAINTSQLWLLPSLLLACCAAWRLAKFNIDTRQTTSFRGVPTPITGFVVASFPLILWYGGEPITGVLLNPWVLYGITLVLSALMVSDLPILSLKIKDKSLRNNLPQLLLLGFALLLLLFFRWAALPLIYVSYVALSLLFRKQISST